MVNQIRAYVGELFAEVPASRKAGELREEICSNLIDKYIDLTGQGVAEEDAYSSAIASIGNIDAMLETLKSPVAVAEDPAARRRSARNIAIAVGLYIASVIPVSGAALINIEYDSMAAMGLGVVIMFAFWAAATGLLIYNAMSKPRYRRMDDTIVEEFKEWQMQKSGSNKYRGLFGAVSATLWFIALTIYFLVSFLLSLWYISWIIFLITMALQMILLAIFRYCETSK